MRQILLCSSMLCCFTAAMALPPAPKASMTPAAASSSVLPSVAEDRNLGLPYRRTAQVEASREALRERVRNSRKVFVDQLAEHQGQYVYVRRFSSWAGFGSTTRVSVAKGKVMERAFRAHGRDEATAEAWIERGDAIGSHPPAPQTMEQVYEQCLAVTLATDPEQYAVYVSFFEDGILASCTFRDHNCADDCDEGPWVSDFQFGPLPSARQ